MGIVGAYKYRGRYVIKPEELEVDPGETVLFIGGFEDYAITFEREVLAGLNPGTPHRSDRAILIEDAVNRETESDYSLEMGGVELNGRIIVREPPGFSFFKYALALLVGIAVGVAGTVALS